MLRGGQVGAKVVGEVFSVECGLWHAGQKTRAHTWMDAN